MLRRRTRQQVAAGAFLVSRVVCEKVLEQPWGCLACGAWLACASEQACVWAQYRAPWLLCALGSNSVARITGS